MTDRPQAKGNFGFEGVFFVSKYTSSWRSTIFGLHSTGMKIWLKYLIGIALGVTFALVAGTENTLFVKAADFLSKAAIQFGRYALYPAVFFGFTLSIFELRENRSLFKLAIITSLIICATALLLSFTGLISVLIHTPARIPIFVEGISDVQVLGIAESLLQMLPSSSFEAIVNGTYILPLCIFRSRLCRWQKYRKADYHTYWFSCTDFLCGTGFLCRYVGIRYGGRFGLLGN